MRHLRDEPIQLLARRQLAPDQQVGDLQEGRVLGQLLDRVAAVAQDPLLAVEEGDRAGAGAGVAVAGVEGDQPGLAPQPGDVDGVVALGAADDRKVQLLGHRCGGWPPPCASASSVRHASSSSTAARSSSSSSVVAAILSRANSPCSMPCTISTAAGAGGAKRVAEDEALGDVVATARRRGDGGAELLARRARDVADGVDDRVRGAGRRALAAGLDDRGAALLDVGDELAAQPLLVADDLGRGPAADRRVPGVGELGRRVVAPDGEVVRPRCTWTPAFAASCDRPRLWSSMVIANQRSRGMPW